MGLTFDYFFDEMVFDEIFPAFSSMTIFMLLMILFSMVVSIIIPIIIGIFVYKDSKRHNMNAAMWTLIAILAPSFIGLIIYLIVRSEQPINRCRQCGSPIKKDYLRCPSCGSPLKKQCPSCGHLLEDNWSVCPGCGTSVVQAPITPIPVVTEPEKGIGKIVIPIIIFLIVVAIILSIVLIGSIL